MITDKQRVVALLELRVLCGYSPERNWRSSIDHGADWEVLSQREFDAVAAAARAERPRRMSPTHIVFPNGKHRCCERTTRAASVPGIPTAAQATIAEASPRKQTERV